MNSYIIIKINKVNWMCLGVCIEDIIKKKKYSRLNGNMGHGCYAVDNEGWAYAHDI